MTQEEIKKAFRCLYEKMSGSSRVKDMLLFGAVMSDMMDILAEECPEDAEQFVERLSAVKWNNYLTHTEAQTILEKMQPGAHWNYEEFCQAVKRIDGTIEQEPEYNKYALWVAMNMVYSDSADTIATIMGQARNSIPEETMAKAVYHLALDKLTDEDAVFDIRKYFDVD